VEICEKSQEYRVNHVGHHVGNISVDPAFEAGQFLILAGRRWKVIDVDHERKVLTVEPSPGGRIPFFSPDVGNDIHPRVRERMRALLERADLPVFLDMKAREMLLQARSSARNSGLLTDPFVQDGPDVIWFPWTGSRIQRTLFGLGKFFGGLKVAEEKSYSASSRIALVFEKTTVDRVTEIYRGFLTNCPEPVALAQGFPHRIREKYESFLSDELTAEIFARERIDLAGAIMKIREIEQQRR
jgi:ATP-dependent helicase Lhr and Lhr-like helicase